MGRATRLRLGQDERRIMVIRRHWWLLMRPLLGLLLLLAILPLYAMIEYLAPQFALARYESIFLTVDLALCGLLILKWLAVDFAVWFADSYVITNQRIIEQQGVVVLERREAGLRAVQESNYTISGAEARFFDYGDLKIQTAGRGNPIVFRQVPHPRRIQALLSAHVRAVRTEQGHVKHQDDAISAALTRIFSGSGSTHDAPTQVVPLVTRQAARAQRQMNLLPNETIVHTTRRHPILLARCLVLPCALFALWLAGLHVLRLLVPLSWELAFYLLLALWAGWIVFDWRDDLYVLTSDRLIELRRTPLFFETRNVVQLRAVQDVVLRIALPSGGIFNLGTLTVELSGADPLHLRAVPHADRMQHLIFEAMEMAQQRDRLQDQERLAGTLTEWFEEYHRMQTTP